LSVYLAMARPLPVTARDILAQVELASGLGLIRDAVTIANDASASLSQKVALFGASAVMTPQDRQRLDGLLAAVERQHACIMPALEPQQPLSPASSQGEDDAAEMLRPFSVAVP
jgi:hypothetical protein